MERKSYLKKKKGATFSEKVLKLALSIPKGRVATYGNISHAAGGGAMAAQSITTILGKAYDAGEKQIPFHRIVYADGRVWMNERYDDERKKRYVGEGIEIDRKGRIKDFEKIRIEFK
jgi:methylated-DNA-protein-cysteine methyltransferase-like protein